MDKKTLQQRLKNLETLKDQHLQDIIEIDFVIAGMKPQIDAMPDDEENTENKQNI